MTGKPSAALLRQPEVLTLGAAIIGARPSKTPEEIKTALEDAYWILHPSAANADYKAWQTRNGLVPTTEAEDQAAAKKVSEGMKKFAKGIVGHGQ